MNITILRRKFPEYGDLPDSELMDLFHNLISEILTDPPEKQTESINVPLVESAVNSVGDSVNTVAALLKKALDRLVSLDGKKEIDVRPELLLLSNQLHKIDAAIGKLCDMQMMDNMDMGEADTTPEPPEPAMPRIIEFKVKRDELGGLDKVIPVYEA